MNKVILWDFGGLTYKPLNKARLLVVGWFRFPGFCRLTLESRLQADSEQGSRRLGQVVWDTQ